MENKMTMENKKKLTTK